MILEIFLALSWVMPSLRATLIRYSLPDGFGSPASRVLSETPRLTSLSLKTSRTALARSSLLARMSTACSPDHAMDAPTPRKSNRVPISLAAWLTALSTSWRSSLDTMSKEDSCAATAPRLDATRAERHAERVMTWARARDGNPLTVWSRCGLSFWMPPALRHTAGCPSGQRERSVKPSAQPTLVRTQHLPPPAEMARLLRILALAGRFFPVPACVTLWRCRSSYCAVHGRIADGRSCCKDGRRAQLRRSVCAVVAVGVHRRRFHGRPRTGRAGGVSGFAVNGGRARIPCGRSAPVSFPGKARPG